MHHKQSAEQYKDHTTLTCPFETFAVEIASSTIFTRCSVVINKYKISTIICLMIKNKQTQVQYKTPLESRNTHTTATRSQYVAFEPLLFKT